MYIQFSTVRFCKSINLELEVIHKIVYHNF